MQFMLRLALKIFLALSLVLSAPAYAAERGAQKPVGTMVLCAAGALTTVFTDASGAPIALPHHCPDCITADTDDLTVARRRSQAVLPTRIVRLPLQGTMSYCADPLLYFTARAPPA